MKSWRPVLPGRPLGISGIILATVLYAEQSQ